MQLVQWIRSLVEHPKQHNRGGIAIGVLLLLAGAFTQLGTWNGLVLMLGGFLLATSLAAHFSFEVSVDSASEGYGEEADPDHKDELSAELPDELESLVEEEALEEQE